MDHLHAAFHDICKDAKPAQSSYVSLYVDLPYYGGAEEGGWWGSDTELVAYYQCSSDVEAKVVRERVLERALEWNELASQRFYEQCARECEWVEERDPMADASDYFPEPDGEQKYWVATETRPGSCVSQGSRHYE